MKLWLRAVDANFESICKPLLIQGEVVRESGKPYFKVRPLIRGSRRMYAVLDGILEHLVYVDPKNGQALPQESWPRMVYARDVQVGNPLALQASRLSVYLPESTSIEQPCIDCYGNPQLPTTEPTVPSWSRQAAPAPPWATPEPARFLTLDGRTINEEMARAEGILPPLEPPVPEPSPELALALDALARDEVHDPRIREMMRMNQAIRDEIDAAAPRVVTEAPRPWANVPLPTFVLNDDGEIVRAPD